MRDMQPGEASANQAEAQKLVRLQEATRIRAQAREAAHAEAWAQARAKIRGALILAVLASLAIGIVIGAYGLQPATKGALEGIDPPQRWGPTAETAQIAEDAHALGPTITPWPVRVYVSGAVAEAQVVELPPGSLVVDALRVAGGTSEHADPDALNLAAPLFDNQHLLVPRRHVPPPSGSEEGHGEIPRIDINTATAEVLELLPAIGTVRARDIVAYRNAHGPFRQVGELLAVPGIGPSIFEQIAPFITVEP
jgi:competence protein ComEA